MEITVDNQTLSPVLLVTVDSMSKQERKEGVVAPGVGFSFYIPGVVPFELQVKDFNTGATKYQTGIITPSESRSHSFGNNPEQTIHFSYPGAETVTSEVLGFMDLSRL
jgi:hypothetical protein